MKSHDLRKKFIDYMKESPRDHKEIPNLSLVPEGDSTLLFVNSGMFPLVPYLSGEVKHPLGKRICNVQRCLRVEDIEEVGDRRHTTFFEMVGNWSLGDYGKKEQLIQWFNFVVKELGIDPNRLYSTVFAGNEDAGRDEETIDILKNIYASFDMDANVVQDTAEEAEGPDCEINEELDRIFPYPKKKNWWQRGDALGELGGTTSELFYRTDREHKEEFGKHCHPNCDCGRYIEIGNSVFMDFIMTKEGWKPLDQKNIDFGGGFERLLMAADQKDSIFETDIFYPIIKKLEEGSGYIYLKDSKYNTSFEVISDHLRGSVFLIADGILPSNKDQGYILRRLIRRAVRYGMKMGLMKNFLADGVEACIKIFKDHEAYSHLADQKELIQETIAKEETNFRTTIERGLREFDKLFRDKKKISGKEAFYLYETFGFPIEMIEEEAANKKIEVDSDGFKKAQTEHQEKSRAGAKKKFTSGLADQSEEVTKLHTATHLLHAALRKVLGDQVEQRGSNITAERLRFDFNFDRRVEDEEKKKIEELVNEQIDKKVNVIREEMTVDEAKEAGAMGLFDSKYGDKVSVYSIPGYSKEICSGPHVKNTGDLGKFMIKKEESAGAGIRRIKAILVDKK